MDFIAANDGCRLAYRWDGPVGAPILLLSNSLGTDHDMWDAQVAELGQDLRILRYDQRGHGRSDAPPGAYSMDRLGQDVLDLLDALAIPAVHFCGLSLGGMVGQWLAWRAPDRVERLVLANTAAYMGPASTWQQRIEGVRRDGMEPLAEASIARWFTPDFPGRQPAAVARIRTMLLGNNAQGYAGCCAAIRDMDQRPTAHLNRLPTLVIAGDQDAATPVAAATFLAGQAQDASLRVLTPAAHLSNVERPSEFTAALREFLLNAPALA